MLYDLFAIDERVRTHRQGQPESDFAKRMYVYNYRLFDRYDRPVVSLAVLGDPVGQTLASCGGSLIIFKDERR